MAVSGKTVAEGDSIRATILKRVSAPDGFKTTVVNKNANYDQAMIRLQRKGIEYQLIEDSPYRQVWGCKTADFEAMMKAGTSHRRSLVQEERRQRGSEATRSKGTAMRLKDIGDTMPEQAPAAYEKVSGESPEE